MDKDLTSKGGEFFLYETEDGKTRVECRVDNDTIWLPQALIAELFDTTPQNITLHLKSLYEENEIEEEATCKDYLQVRTEGKREVNPHPKVASYINPRQRPYININSEASPRPNGAFYVSLGQRPRYATPQHTVALKGWSKLCPSHSLKTPSTLFSLQRRFFGEFSARFWG